MDIKENFTPIVTLVRRIPHSLKPKVEKELKHMVDFDIIEPVDEPNYWVYGLVIASRKTKLKTKNLFWPLTS